MRTDINSILQKMRTAIPEPLHIACPSIQLADVMKERLKNGSKFPVPFSEIGSEFELLKENNPNNDKILSDVKAGAY